MRNASPAAMSSSNAASTAPQQAGNAPMCSGSTTCCATTSPAAFISAQEASCDSRTMVEKPVRNSEFCISCTMPESEALTTSRSTASIRIFVSLRHDQILPFVHPRHVPGADHRGAVELIEHRRAHHAQAHVELLALIDRAGDRLAVEPHLPCLAQRIRQAGADAREARHLDRRHFADAAHPVRYDLDRLVRRAVAKHGLMPRVECGAQLRKFGDRVAWDRDLVALPGVTHVGGALQPDLRLAETVGGELGGCLRGQ